MLGRHSLLLVEHGFGMVPRLRECPRWEDVALPWRLRSYQGVVHATVAAAKKGNLCPEASHDVLCIIVELQDIVHCRLASSAIRQVQLCVEHLAHCPEICILLAIGGTLVVRRQVLPDRR